MVGAGLLINLLAPHPPKKGESLPKPKLEQTRKFFSPKGKKFPGLLNFYILLWQRQKTLLLRKKNTHTFFKMDEDKSSFLYLPSNVASQRYVSNTPSHFKFH